MIHHNRRANDFLAPGRIDMPGGIQFASPEESTERAGLHYRSNDFPGLSRLVQECLDGSLPFGELTVDAYQSWVETGWKSPHGTLHAAIRLREKGTEEHRELQEALTEYLEAGDATHLIEEAGDNLWVSTARSSNAGNIVGDSIKTRLYQYIAGTQVYVDGQPTEPAWYDAVAQLAIKRGSPTLGDIDGIFSEGFVPRMSPVMNLDDEEEISPEEAVFDIGVLGIGASGVNLRQHEREDGEWEVLSPARYEAMAQDVGAFTSEVYFRIAALARYAGSSLVETVRTNMTKINLRIAQGLIDKSDGART